MKQAGLDALLVYSWKRGQVRYLSGYHPNYIANVALVLLPIEGDPVMLIRFPFDLERARRESWIKEVYSAGNLSNFSPIVGKIMAQRGIYPRRIGLVTGDEMMDEMPYNQYLALINVMAPAECVNANYIFGDLRITKSKAEFTLLRGSARLADAGAAAAARVIKSGCSEFDVVASAEAEVRRLGAGNYLAVIASKGETELIGPPEKKVLETGDNVIFELAVEKDGYWTQVARVFYTSKPTADQMHIYQVTYRAYLAAVEAVHPGVPCACIAEAARQVIEKAGFCEYTEQDFGHGIGLDLPEPPKLATEEKLVIETGMVLVIHPAIRISQLGGAFVGGTVLVHTDHNEPLHQIPNLPFQV